MIYPDYERRSNGSHSTTDGLMPHHHPVGMLQCNCSISAIRTRAKRWMIDPGDEVTRILD